VKDLDTKVPIALLLLAVIVMAKDPSVLSLEVTRKSPQVAQPAKLLVCMLRRTVLVAMAKERRISPKLIL